MRCGEPGIVESGIHGPYSFDRAGGNECSNFCRFPLPLAYYRCLPKGRQMHAILTKGTKNLVRTLGTVRRTGAQAY